MKADVKTSGAKQTFNTGAKRDSQEGKPRFDLVPWWVIEREAAHLAKGARHYGDWNWSKGIPVDRAFTSLMRHVGAMIRGQTDEDHFAAALFNLMVMEDGINGVREGRYPVEHLGYMQTRPGCYEMRDLQEVVVGLAAIRAESAAESEVQAALVERREQTEAIHRPWESREWKGHLIDNRLTGDHAAT